MFGCVILGERSGTSSTQRTARASRPRQGRIPKPTIQNRRAPLDEAEARARRIGQRHDPNATSSALSLSRSASTQPLCITHFVRSCPGATGAEGDARSRPASERDCWAVWLSRDVPSSARSRGRRQRRAGARDLRPGAEGGNAETQTPAYASSGGFSAYRVKNVDAVTPSAAATVLSGLLPESEPAAAPGDRPRAVVLPDAAHHHLGRSRRSRHRHCALSSRLLTERRIVVAVRARIGQREEWRPDPGLPTSDYRHDGTSNSPRQIRAR